MIVGVILSAGRSERMGSPKALLAYRGDTFLGHVYRTAVKSSLDQVRVVLGHRPRPIIDALGLPPGEIVLNEGYDRGMLSSLQEGLRALAPDRPEAIVMFLVDHPRVSVALVDNIVAAFRKGRGEIVIPVHDGRRGHPVLFSAALFDELLAAPPDKGARHVVRAHPELVCELPAGTSGVLIDIDTPDDYAQLERDDE